MIAKEQMRTVFKKLRKKECLCRMAYGCCMNCACAELEQMRNKRKLKGVVYWHRQDEGNYKKTGILEVRYFTASGEESKALGDYIATLLNNLNAIWNWDDDPAHTITVYNTEEIKVNDLRKS